MFGAQYISIQKYGLFKRINADCFLSIKAGAAFWGANDLGGWLELSIAES